jgi:Tol biopolymer transport system component
LKVLPDSVARDRERLARFDREAKLLASLSHPHIAALYALEQVDGKPVLVMELAAGDDLSVRIDRGPIPLDDTVPIATNIALALEAAHERGIVHRDLKPSNIKIAGEDAVKVLDFGLAKAFAAEDAGSSDAMNSPTLTAQATAAGVILGTAAYMSPEQARGRAADKRADIWAFGVVVFEMLTGKRLFGGETISDTLAAVLRQDIDWTALPAGTPSDLVRLLKRCLERDRKNRLHDVADARIVLEEIQRGGPVASVAARSAPARRSPPLWIAASVVLAALAVGVLAGRYGRESTTGAASTLRTMRLALSKPNGIESVNDPVAAADGTFVVFVGITGSQSKLYVHRLDEIEPRPMRGTEGATTPFLSPDDRWIGYESHGRTYKISVDGGDPLPLVGELNISPGAAWLRDGTILAPQNWSSGFSVYTPGGSAPRAMTALDASRGERGHWFPRLLPDGRHVLFTVMRNGSGLNDADVAVLDLSTGTHRVLLAGAEGLYMPPGYLVFFRAGVYQVIRFDLATLQVSGEPMRALEDARGLSPDGESTKVSISGTGIVAYRNGPLYVDTQLTWVAEGGALEALPIPPRPFTDLDLSPDGRRAAAGAVQAGRFVLRLIDLDRRNDDVLDLPGSNWNAFWNPDGRRLAIRSMNGGQYDAYLLDLAGGAPTPLLVTDQDDMPDGWTHDGKFALVRQATANGQYPLYKLEPGHPEAKVQLTEEGSKFAVSPDGRWLAFITGKSGSDEMYVQRMVENGKPVRISTLGATALSWSRKRNELFYARSTEIVAVTYRDEQEQFRVEKERLWATVKGLDAYNIFEATPDGRIIVDLPPTPVPPSQIRVLLGWANDLAQKFRK